MPALVISWTTFSEFSVNGSTGGASRDLSGGSAGSDATLLPTAYSIDRDSTRTCCPTALAHQTDPEANRPLRAAARSYQRALDTLAEQTGLAA
jgi:hypothetical protein